MFSPTTHPDVRTEQKILAANWAASQLRNGMVVGLGSGSTAALVVSAIGRLVSGGLKIFGVSTSENTSAYARSLSIPLITLATPEIDITIDGADEVIQGSVNLIKGGGGNLLREKIVAVGSREVMIVVDENKVVTKLGARSPVPVEVVQFGWQSTATRLAAIGCKPEMRMAEDRKPFVTDGGNYILDCTFEKIQSAQALQSQLDATVGVVEHGLFIGIASLVVVGTADGVRILGKHSPDIS